MTKLQFDSDRTIDSTDNNEYSDDMRDENLWDADLADTEISVDDTIPDGVNELKQGERPLYDEQGYKNDPGE